MDPPDRVVRDPRRLLDDDINLTVMLPPSAYHRRRVPVSGAVAESFVVQGRVSIQVDSDLLGASVDLPVGTHTRLAS